MEVLTAQGHLHAADVRRWRSRTSRAAVLEPANEEIRQATEAVRAARAHRLELGYDFQHFNSTSDDTHTGTFEFNARLSDAFRIFAIGQTHHAFDDYENRFGGGIEWFAPGSVFIRTGAVVGSDTFELPEKDVFGTLVWKGPRVDLGFDLRFVDYEAADLWIGGPTLAWKMTNRHGLRGIPVGPHQHGLCDQHDEHRHHKGRLQNPSRPARIGHGRCRHGIDRLDWLTVDRLSAPDANTFSSAPVSTSPRSSLDGRFDHQSRPDDLTVQRGSGRLIFRF